jgi:hypothetical protein
MYSDTQDTQNDSYSDTNQLLIRPGIYLWMGVPRPDITAKDMFDQTLDSEFTGHISLEG